MLVVLAVYAITWLAASHSAGVSMAAVLAPEQTKYLRLAAAVALSVPADQLSVKPVVLRPVEAAKMPAVGEVVSTLISGERRSSLFPSRRTATQIFHRPSPIA